MWFDSLLYFITKSRWILLFPLMSGPWLHFKCFLSSSWCQEINAHISISTSNWTFSVNTKLSRMACRTFTVSYSLKKTYLLSLLSLSSPSALSALQVLSSSLPPCQLYCPYGSTLLTPRQTSWSKSAKTLVQAASADFKFKFRVTTSLWLRFGWQGLGFVRVLERMLIKFCSYWVTANILHAVCAPIRIVVAGSGQCQCSESNLNLKFLRYDAGSHDISGRGGAHCHSFTGITMVNFRLQLGSFGLLTRSGSLAPPSEPEWSSSDSSSLAPTQSDSAKIWRCEVASHDRTARAANAPQSGITPATAWSDTRSLYGFARIATGGGVCSSPANAWAIWWRIGSYMRSEQKCCFSDKRRGVCFR